MTMDQWCDQAAWYNPLAAVMCIGHDARHAASNAADLYSNVRYGTDYSIRPPLPPAPAVTAVDPQTGAVTMETPQAAMERYRSQVNAFFTGLDDTANRTACSRPWALFDSACSKNSVLWWVAAGAAAFILLRTVTK